jgi:hypothetical protein
VQFLSWRGVDFAGVVLEGSLDIALARHGEQTVIEESNSEHLTVVRGTEEAPLWGAPLQGKEGDILHEPIG